MQCMVCGSPVVHIGDCGIVDWDDRWDLQTSRYVCENDHMIFIGNQASNIIELEAEEAKEFNTWIAGMDKWLAEGNR